MSSDLLGVEPTDRDWQALAWRRLSDVRAKHAGWTLDQALAHETIGRIVRAFAAQLKRQAEEKKASEAKEARFGARVAWNGYGYRRLKR